MLKKYIFPLWILSSICLFLYSYTQVDLSLTLSRASFVKNIETSFQHVGWFNRPLSTYLYIGVVLLLFFSYFLTIKLVHNNKISRKTVWTVILVVSVILTFSYNAFSYDLFNYIFDAKIITHYAQNPYIHKALDFPNDPMLSFMRWTHRIYPYGPTWLVFTVPLSFIGAQIFIVTFFIFKIAIASTFLLSCFFIEKISRLYKKEDHLFPLVLFALNPLVLIESLVSSHNDIVMMFFAILGVYFLFLQKRMVSIFYFLFSILIKFATAVMIIPFALYLKTKKKEQFFLTSLVLMIAPLIAVTFRTNFQPWYFLLVIPFAVFLNKKYYVIIPFYILSFLACFYYLPFLYTGNWDAPIPFVLNIGVMVAIGISILLVILTKLLGFTKRF